MVHKRCDWNGPWLGDLEFAELLGSQVEVRSEPQQGTRFEVTLPMSAEMLSR
jgi:hypothetical protein